MFDMLASQPKTEGGIRTMSRTHTIALLRRHESQLRLKQAKKSSLLKWGPS